MVLGAYLVFAFDRFGTAAFFEPRAAVRMMLIGFYGWMWLVGAMWLIARAAFGSTGSPSPLVPLVGHAHLPLLVLAVFIQFTSGFAGGTGPGFWLALFAGGLWMPAMLVAAASNFARLTLPQSLVAGGLPYLVWVVVVGRILWTQLEHLL